MQSSATNYAASELAAGTQAVCLHIDLRYSLFTVGKENLISFIFSSRSHFSGYD